MSFFRAHKIGVQVAGLLATAAIMLGTPLFLSGSASADDSTPPPPPPTNTTDGHEWV
jgi:hypothetical protein